MAAVQSSTHTALETNQTITRVLTMVFMVRGCQMAGRLNTVGFDRNFRSDVGFEFSAAKRRSPLCAA